MERSTSPIAEYTAVAKIFHWVTAALFMAQFPVGYALVQINPGRMANFLFDAHKLIGIVIFWVVVLRAAYRTRHRALRTSAQLAPWHTMVSRLVHFVIYALLLGVPLLGWLGATAFGKQSVFGWFTLPSLVSPDAKFSALVLYWHGLMAFVLLAAIFLHIAIAMQGYLEARDDQASGTTGPGKLAAPHAPVS